MPNDVIKYPEDGFDFMKVFSLKHEFNFPYLFDEEQNVAKKFGAVCTPDFLDTIRIMNYNIEVD